MNKTIEKEKKAEQLSQLITKLGREVLEKDRLQVAINVCDDVS